MDTTEESRAYHHPVLLHEIVDILITNPAGTYIDGTLGGGGHTEAILKKLSPEGRVLAFDVDDDAIEYAQHRLAGDQKRIRFVRNNFSSIAAVVQETGSTPVSGILVDLGVSSHQIDAPERGFSFQSDTRLDMRMDVRTPNNAWNVVNQYDEQHLADILVHYGEERRSHQIARTIVRERLKAPIDTTGKLTAIITGIVGERFAKKTLARVFQAIRIEVNRELENLESFLRQVPDVLAPHGRIAAISYHSLEDRIVKTFFRQEAADVIRSGHKLIPDQPREPRLRILTKDPIIPGDEECAENPRARSAKLRIAERV
jgi:16S rRNA (cytosine1402-N4)-methyltransferase